VDGWVSPWPFVFSARQELEKQNNQTTKNQDLTFSNFDVYSLSNVETGSPKMWAHLICVYLVVIYTLWVSEASSGARRGCARVG
jgi:hypothetical protein